MNSYKKDGSVVRNDRDMIYFDNAATTHKPQQVIDAVSNFYAQDYATVHRSMYDKAELVTGALETVRAKVAHFIGADTDEIIFTSGATAGINFIASTFGLEHIGPGDEIVVTELEHHANLVPWQQVAQKTGAVLKFIPITQDGTLDLSDLNTIITPATKLVSVIHVSNALGSHTDLAPIIARAHQVGAVVLVDAAQSVPHQKIDLKKLGADFLVFSGHKLLGPTGIGVLYINKLVQQRVTPYQFGGGMVYDVDYDATRFASAPHCYEAGTPPIAQIIGLGAALDILNTVDFDQLQKHEAALTDRLITGLQRLPGVTILGPIDELRQQGHLVSFTVDGYHPHDIGAYLDQHGIAVRAGHFCAQPLLKKLGLAGAVRVSFYRDNTLEEVDRFLAVLGQLTG